MGRPHVVPTEEVEFETWGRTLIPLPYSRGRTYHVFREKTCSDPTQCGCLKRVCHFKNGNRLVIHEEGN